MTWLILLILFILTLLYLRQRLFSSSSSLSVPPGPRGLPLVGSVWVMADPIRAFSTFRRRFGDLFGVWLGQKYLVVVCDQKTAREVLVTKGWSFATRPNILTFELMNGKPKSGISHSSGEFNKQHRKFVLIALKEFGMGKSDMEARVQIEAKELVMHLSKQNGKAVCPQDIVMAAASNVICQVTVGKRFDYDDPKFIRFMQYSDKVERHLGGAGYLNWMNWTKYLPYWRESYKALEECRRVIHGEFLKPAIEEHKKTFDDSYMRDVLDCYLKEMKKENSTYTVFTEENLLFALNDMFLAGTDTTATSVLWAMLNMLNYPECAEKVYREVEEELGDSKMVTSAHKKILKYTEAFLLETWRVGNIVPLGVFHHAAREVELSGFRIPADSWVAINYHEILNDPKYWKNPDQFRPERFLNGENVDGFFPFSLGPRNCPGEGLARVEVFIVFTTLVQHFRFEVEEGASSPPPLKGHVGITHSPLRYKLRFVEK